MIYLIISITIFSFYVGYTVDRYGVQKSISVTYYFLPIKQKWMFTLALVGFAIPVAIIGSTFLLFLAATLICLVATAPLFEGSKMEYYAHMFGAYVGIGLGFLSLIIDFEMYYLVGVAGIICMFLYKYASNHIFYIEIVAFLTIWIGLFINLKL